MLDLHHQIIEQSKGAMGIRDLGAFSAVKVIALSNAKTLERVQVERTTKTQRTQRLIAPV